MLSNERPTREIKIKSTDEEWIKRLVSKLLLSGSRFHVLWSSHQITVRLDEENMACLAKKMTAPVFRYGIYRLQKEDANRFTGLQEWESWSKDERFMEYLLTDERFDSIRVTLLTVLEENVLNIEEWFDSSEVWNEVLTSIHQDVQEGNIGQKLVSGGWV